MPYELDKVIIKKRTLQCIDERFSFYDIKLPDKGTKGVEFLSYLLIVQEYD